MTDDLAGRVRRLPDVVVRTRRLDLVWPTASRTPELLRLLAEPSVARWTGSIPFPYGRKDAAEFLARARRNRRTGTGLSLQVMLRANGALLGGVGLHHLNGERRSAEIGYWIGRPYRGAGYTREAVAGMLGLAFHRLRLHRVYATVLPGNAPSLGVLRANGFRYEGRIRDEVFKDGRWRSVVQYSRLASDPPVRLGRRTPPVGRRQARGGRTR